MDPSPRDEEGLRDDLLGVVGRYSSLRVPEDSIGLLLVESFDLVSRILLQGRLLGKPTTPYVRLGSASFILRVGIAPEGLTNVPPPVMAQRP
jgi:hypothetical protein